MRGLLLAGGSGSRLLPATRAVNKQLLPVHDKPTVYYPLTTLLLAGVRELTVITAPRDADAFRGLLGDGSHLGVEIGYAVQDAPRGLADAFLVAERFCAGHRVALALGDNLLHGPGLRPELAARAAAGGAHLFAHPVADPRAFGVVELDPAGRVRSLEEKPAHPRSRYAVPGFYLFPGDVADVARTVRPSARGELEITDVHLAYLRRGELTASVLPEGTVWLDTGTVEAAADAAGYVRAVQQATGGPVGSPEAAAWRQGWIDDAALLALARREAASPYGRMLASLVAGDVDLRSGREVAARA